LSECFSNFYPIELSFIQAPKDTQQPSCIMPFIGL
jgi:hypothetical protein